MTQVDLADKLKVSTKTVSKWEQNIVVPNLDIFPDLAQVLGIKMSDLLDEKNNTIKKERGEIQTLIVLACETVGLAMGVSVFVLNMLDKLQVKNAITMLGFGFFCIGFSLIIKNNSNK